MEHTAKRIFEVYTELQEIYITSDGQGFTDKDKAESHTQYLANKEISHFTRAEIENEAKVEIEVKTEAKAEIEVKTEAKVEKLKTDNQESTGAKTETEAEIEVEGEPKTDNQQPIGAKVEAEESSTNKKTKTKK